MGRRQESQEEKQNPYERKRLRFAVVYATVLSLLSLSTGNYLGAHFMNERLRPASVNEHRRVCMDLQDLELPDRERVYLQREKKLLQNKPEVGAFYERASHTGFRGLFSMVLASSLIGAGYTHANHLKKKEKEWDFIKEIKSLRR